MQTEIPPYSLAVEKNWIGVPRNIELWSVLLKASYVHLKLWSSFLDRLFSNEMEKGRPVRREAFF